jgi:hypothetical protein
MRVTSEVHNRRFSRNVGVALSLLGLVAISFGLAVVKITNGEPMERFDHVVRPAMEVAADE